MASGPSVVLTTAPKAISCHTWNKDQSKIALCPNDNTIQIYRRTSSGFELETTLEEHSQVVMGIDWAPEANRIVSCGEDRNAYVWEYKQNKWSPTLVILRINRAATSVKWSPNELKFAVSSGAKCVSICYYEAENNWWISKHIKKDIKSTVTCIDWNNDNSLVACGATDFKCRIYNAAVKGVDKKPAPSPWGGKIAFGELVAEFDFGTGWIHDVSWSPDGNKLAFVSHDSRLTIVEASGNVSVIKSKDLPYKTVRFLTNNTLVAAGHDANPAIYWGQDGAQWEFATRLDSNEKKAAKAKVGVGAAMDKFKAADKLGAAPGAVETQVATTHQNCITTITKFGREDISTSGMDGMVVTWPLRAIGTNLGVQIV